MSVYKEHIKPIVVLTVICIVVSALLGVANGITLPIIERQELLASQKGMRELLPDATDFTQLTSTVEGVTAMYKDDGGSGYIIEAVAKGNNGDVNTMVGLDASGKVVGVKVTSHSEDNGIGTRAFEDSHLQLFVGVSESADGVDKVSGATYSSKALQKTVNIAFEAYREAQNNG